MVISREGSGYRTDCTFHLSSGMNLHAEGRGARALRVFRAGGRQDRGAFAATRSGSRITPAFRGGGRGKVANYVVEPPQDEEEPAGGFNPVVVAEGTDELKSLSVASAVAELDLSGAPVVVFQHAGSGRVNIVYRRRDGAIGWLDPQASRDPPGAAEAGRTCRYRNSSSRTRSCPPCGSTARSRRCRK